MKRKWLLAAALCLAFLALAGCSADTGMNKNNETNGGDKNMNSGEQAADFEMTDLNGNVVRLSDFAAEKVYIKYWASWCPVCLGGLADINALSAENNDFKVLTIVAPGHQGEKSADDFRAWFAGVENTENITVLFDTDGAYAAQAGVRGFPTSEYIGSDGAVVSLTPGHADNDAIKANFKTIH